MKAQIIEIINKHNKVIEAVENSLGEISITDWFKYQPINTALCSEGIAITHYARENGIDAKCNMQSGYISVYGDI